MVLSTPTSRIWVTPQSTFTDDDWLVPKLGLHQVGRTHENEQGCSLVITPQWVYGSLIEFFVHLPKGIAFSQLNVPALVFNS
jgi:hypothetical protein